MLRKHSLEMKYYKLSVKEDPNYEESWIALIKFYINQKKSKKCFNILQQSFENK